MAQMMTEQRMVSIARSYVWNMQKVIQNERTDDDDEDHWGDNQEHDRFLDGDDDVLSDSWRRCSLSYCQTSKWPVSHGAASTVPLRTSAEPTTHISLVFCEVSYYVPAGGSLGDCIFRVFR